MKDIPQHIQELLLKRNVLREEEKYDEADAVREQIEQQGYIVADTEERTTVTKNKDSSQQKPKHSFIVLFGSGETSPSGRMVHEYVFKKMEKDEPSIVLLSTPAGFQPNVETVYGEMSDFFRTRLKNFHPRIKVCYANTREDANNAENVKVLDTADYIFTGAGSPTYTVKHLKDTLLYQKIIERIHEGTTLSIASAATAAFSKHCLPVYEIFKVGEELHWIDGLETYGEFLEPMTIIPHFNNTEGGAKLDTSRCWMGVDRFEKLLKMLPKGQKVLGIDEHTAIAFDLATKECIVRGKGMVYDITPDKVTEYKAGVHEICKK